MGHMTHQDKGHFAQKHTKKQSDPGVAGKIRDLSNNDRITCANAHRAATSLEISPEEIGIQIDLLEFKIIECQMGLFGYTDTKKKLDPVAPIDSNLDKAIDLKTVKQRISCLDCWEIAKQIKAKKLSVGSACEKKKIRIRPCQLGIF